MALTRDEKEILTKGFLQLNISVILYLTFTILGFIGIFILNYIVAGNNIIVYLQGVILLLTQLVSCYLSIKVFHPDKYYMDEK